jgi:glycosyltransferase involved in cell wall biosynthesis
MSQTKKSIAYLSGAPRVSLREIASASGPRSHILGTIKAFTLLGWEVKPFIFGDQVPEGWLHGDTQQTMRKSAIKRLLADFFRFFMNHINRFRALKTLGKDYDWVYERLGAFQSLGRIFQKRGVPWILETNGPNAFEAKHDRQSIALTGLARHIEVSAYRKCDVVVCQTEKLKEIIADFASIPSHKIVVVPNAVDPARFNPDQVSSERFFDFPTIIYVGHVQPWQSILLLLQAIHSLKKESVKLGCVVVGDGPEKEKVQTYSF